MPNESPYGDAQAWILLGCCLTHATPMLRLSSFAVLALALTLSACDVFGPSIETLAFRPLLDSATFVSGEQVLEGGERPSSGVLVFRDADDVDAFRSEFILAEPFPDVDFAAESIVGFILRTDSDDAFVRIAGVELRGGDTLRLAADILGAYADPRVSARRHIVQLVAVPRLAEPIAGFEVFPSGDIDF